MQDLARRGFVRHYVIDATEGDANLTEMLHIFRASSTRRAWRSSARNWSRWTS